MYRLPQLMWLSAGIQRDLKYTTQLHKGRLGKNWSLTRLEYWLSPPLNTRWLGSGLKKVDLNITDLHWSFESVKHCYKLQNLSFTNFKKKFWYMVIRKTWKKRASWYSQTGYTDFQKAETAIQKYWPPDYKSIQIVNL